MKKKIKKILTSTLISAVSITAIGCGTNNSKLASNIDKGMAEFVKSINNLDYVETSNTNQKVGKIVETSSTSASDVNFLNNTISEVNVENSITTPAERTDTFKLFVLSESPYISLTSDDNSASLNMFVKFSTNKIEETSDEIDTKINTLILKRSILTIYVNEIYNGNINISDENRTAINAYVNVIKENASFLKGNRGMVKNQLNLASDLLSTESNENLVNYYIIKSGEALETRSNKIDSTLSAINSIIEILENNLTENSPYYQTKLSSSYDSLISNLNSLNSSTITQENKELADNIASSLNIQNNKKEISSANNTNSQNIQLNNSNTETLNQNNIQYDTLNNSTPTTPSNTTQLNTSRNISNKAINNANLTNNSSTNNQSNTSILNETNLNNQQPSNEIPNSSQEENNENITHQRPTSERARNQARRNVRRNSNRSRQKQNQNQQTINQRNNQSRRVLNMNNHEENVMRADRTKNTQTREEYVSPQTSAMINERAQRVPYTTTSTFNQ